MRLDRGTDANKDDVASEAGVLRTWIGATWRSLNDLRRGIGLRFLGNVLLFSSAVTLVLTLFQLYLDYRHDVGAIESRMAEIEGSSLNSLGEGLWNLDGRQLQLQIEGIHRLPGIRFVEIREITDRGSPMVVTAGQRETRAVVRREFAILHAFRGKQQQIGTLSIEATLIEVYRELLNKTIVILLSQGAKTFLVSFFILYIAHRLVTRHLTGLAEFLGRYDLRHPPPPLRLQRRPPKEKDELDQVVAAFEAMRQSLERAYADLSESEQRFRDYAETASDWFWESGPDHRLTDISLRAFAASAASRIGHRRWDYALDVESAPEKWRQHKAALERHEPFRDFVYRVRRGDGTIGFIATNGKPVFDAAGRFLGYRGVASDITQRKAQEREREELLTRVQQAGKMEAIGRLAGGIAHDFNNLLGAVIGFAGFLKEDLPKGSNQHQFAMSILMACEQAKQLVDQILAFARARDVERKPIDLGAVLHDSGKLLLGTLPSSTNLHFDIAEEKLLVLGNEAQLSQMAINLCINASDALAGEPGTVAVTLTKVRHGSADYVQVNEDLTLPPDEGTRPHVVAGRLDESRDYVRLTVRDTAKGIEPALLPRIFEPFFTTKERGRGTGLGLAAVHGIVMSYEGAYCVESRPGSGTIFSIYFPLVGADRDAAVALETAPPDIRGHERILVVDDEQNVIEMLSIGLKRLGYDVAAADDPAEALATFAADPTTWDVVVSDQTMPGMTGLSLIAKLRSLRPELKVILCTGFSDGTIERSARELGVDCLLKPVEPHRLAARIRVLLDRHAADAQREKEATAGQS